MSQYIRTIRLTSPTTEPVTLAEAKAQLRVETSFSGDDTLITGLIKVARAQAENYCNRLFADATAALIYDAFPVGETPFDIPMPDVVSVDAVTYRDGDNALIAETVGTFDAGYQKLWPDSTWPTEAQGARVEITAGAPVEIGAIKQAIMIMLTDLYEYRGSAVMGTVNSTKAAEMLMQPYRMDMGV